MAFGTVASDAIKMTKLKYKVFLMFTVFLLQHGPLRTFNAGNGEVWRRECRAAS
jgi:hypothetical protein